MLLRSASTPILGSLLSSSSTPHFSESPINHHHHHHHHQIPEKSSSISSSSFPHFSRHFSPLSDPSDPNPNAPSIRRSRSEGNLQSLLPSDRRSNPVLNTIPSFSVYNSKEVQEEEEEEYEEEVGIQGSITMGESNSGEFGFVGNHHNLILEENSSEIGALPLFLARGLGIDRVGSGFFTAGGFGFGGGGGGGHGDSFNNGSGGEKSDLEGYYKRMVEENPSNALFLRNYAHFLYETKKDPQRAEEYYSRAILAEPGDGDTLSQYAKLVWSLHHDKERASSYFEQAVQAAPDDSHVLAAFAGFLWEAEDDGVGEEEDAQSQDYFRTPVHHGILATGNA